MRSGEHFTTGRRPLLNRMLTISNLKHNALAANLIYEPAIRFEKLKIYKDENEIDDTNSCRRPLHRRRQPRPKAAFGRSP